MKILIEGQTILNVSNFLKFIFFEEKKTFSESYGKRNKNDYRLNFSKLYKHLAFCVNVDKSRRAIRKFENH